MDLAPCDEELPKCTIGQSNNSSCHLLTYHKSTKKLKAFDDFSSEQKQLLSVRSGLNLNSQSKICLHHEALLLTKFECLQRTCCNPFSKKDHHVRKSLRLVDQNVATQLKGFGKNILPGQKICTSCRIDLGNKLAKSSEPCTSDEDVQMEVCEKVNTSLTTMGVSPVKFHQVSKRDLKGYAKRKICQAQSLITAHIATAGGLNPTDIHQVASTSTAQCNSCKDYAQLLSELKEKMVISNRVEKLQILTLAPNSWSIKQTMDEFGISERMVKAARKLKNDSGLLALPGQKKGKMLHDDVKNRVLNFYEDDEYSRLCPGMKDCVSVRIEGEKVQKQKRLLLSNLKELFVAYRNKHGSEIGFSKFSELRPKWCVTVGSAGMHSVCVCVIHQNVKLMLASCTAEKDYKFLMGLTVCSLESKNCMLHRCDLCPGKNALETYLCDLYKDVDPEEPVQFKQWAQTDRTSLEIKQMSTEDFIVELATKISDLSIHHFVSKNQTQYLKTVKEHLNPGEAAVLLDFAENYSFIVQDAVQGFHWENSQATIHPIVVYYLENGQTQCKSVCIISDCLRHDTIAVHVFIVKLLEFLRHMFTDLNKIFYFSDGSAAQYKNLKNFANLCHHFDDFGVLAEWNFFGTSHGKSPCDGIGGTVKRLAARASLQRPKENQILTPSDLYTFCEQNLKKIKFVFVEKTEIEAARSDQEKRFASACTIAGTRENHQFIPISSHSIQVRRVSGDFSSSFTAKVTNSTEVNQQETTVSDLQPGQYVACIYDNNWWIGNICEVSIEQHDALINFMHPHGPSHLFYWPSRKDSCWIPEQHILANVPVPTATSLGRQYHFPDVVIQNISRTFQLMQH